MSPLHLPTHQQSVTVVTFYCTKVKIVIGDGNREIYYDFTLRLSVITNHFFI